MALSRRNAVVLALVALAFAATWALLLFDSGPRGAAIERLLKATLGNGAPALGADGVEATVKAEDIARMERAICRRDKSAGGGDETFACGAAFSTGDAAHYLSAFRAIERDGADPAAIEGYLPGNLPIDQQREVLRRFGLLK